MNFPRKIAMKNHDVSWTMPKAQKALAVPSPIRCCSSFLTMVLTTLQVSRQPEQSSSSLQTREGHIGPTYLKYVWNSQPWSLSHCLKTIAFVFTCLENFPILVITWLSYKLYKKSFKIPIQMNLNVLNHFYIKLSLYRVISE